MRRLELIHLSIHNIDLERGTVMIRQGKGPEGQADPHRGAGAGLDREVPGHGAAGAGGREG